MERASPPLLRRRNPARGQDAARRLLNASADLWMSRWSRRASSQRFHAGRCQPATAIWPTRAGLRSADRRRCAATRAFWRSRRHRGWRARAPAGEWWAACPRRDSRAVVGGALPLRPIAREVAIAPKPWDEIVWGEPDAGVYMGERSRCWRRCLGAPSFDSLVRDPRDCVLSTEGARGGNSALRTCAGVGRPACGAAATAGARARCGRASSGSRYEDLAADVGVRARARVFDFLGVPAPVRRRAGCCARGTSAAATGATRVRRGKPSPSGRAACRRELRRRIEEITGDLLAALRLRAAEHPAAPTRSLSRMRLVAYRFRDAWLQLASGVAKLGSWASRRCAS